MHLNNNNKNFVDILKPETTENFIDEYLIPIKKCLTYLLLDQNT